MANRVELADEEGNAITAANPLPTTSGGGGIPATTGSQADDDSLSVTQSTEDKAAALLRATAANQEINNARAGVIFRNNPAAFNLTEGDQAPITGNQYGIPYSIPFDIVTGAAAALNVDVGIIGCTPYVSLDLDETEEEVKAAAGRIYFFHVMNLAATKRYFKIYDAPAASVVVGTTVPKLVFPIGTLGDTNGVGFCLSIAGGILFTTGICIAATTGLAHADTGAPGGNEVVVNLGYL